MRYELIIYWSKDDESFVVEVPELPGCMADGQSYAEAVANAEVVIDEWIETARKLDRPIPEPRGKLAYAWSHHCHSSLITVRNEARSTRLRNPHLVFGGKRR